MATRPDPPAPDEVEVTLLGRGVGESCVVHLGGGRWMVVDSFKHDGRPAAQGYLDRLGVPPEAVTDLIVTHFHRDHYEGMVELFDHYPRAALSVTAVTDSRLFELLRGQPTRLDVLGGLPGLIERAKRRDSTPPLHSFTSLKVGTTFIELDGDGTAPAVRVRALSPAEDAYVAMCDEIAAMLSQGTTDAELRSRLKDRNLASVALYVTVGDVNLLLGADLVADDSMGWPSVLADSRHEQLPPASLYKVPHHGSPNAHLPELWGRLVDENARLLVSPYSTSKRPRPPDCVRLRALGPLWQAAPSSPEEAQPPQVREVEGNLIEVPEVVGRVQARRRVGEEAWRVEVDPPAFEHE